LSNPTPTVNRFQSSPFFYLQHFADFVQVLVSDFVQVLVQALVSDAAQHFVSDFVQVLVTSVFAFVQHPEVVFVVEHPTKKKNAEIAIKCFIVFDFYFICIF